MAIRHDLNLATVAPHFPALHMIWRYPSFVVPRPSSLFYTQ